MSKVLVAYFSASGNWLEGARLNAGVSEAELQEWINSLK